MDFFILAYYEKMEGTKSNNNGNQIDEDVSIDRQSTPSSSKKRKGDFGDHQRYTSTSGEKGTQQTEQYTELDAVKQLISDLEKNLQSIVKESKVISEEYKLLLKFLGKLEEFWFPNVRNNLTVSQRINDIERHMSNLINEKKLLTTTKNNLIAEKEDLIAEKNNLRAWVPLLFESNENLRDERDALMDFFTSIESLNFITPPSYQSLKDRIDAVMQMVPFF